MGRSQNYRVTANATEQLSRLSVYLDGSNTAKAVELALYTSASASSAGNRLGRCVITATAANAWNRCSIAAASVTNGTTYWLAILHPTGSSGTVKYRTRTDAGRTFGSSSGTLAQHPTSWSNGSDWGAQTASVYADRLVQTDFPPTGVKASANGSSVVLDWDDSRDPIFSYFAVRRSVDPTTDKATWTRLAPNYLTSTATDSGRAAGTYYYYVTQASKDGTVSSRSVVASATVGAPPSPTPTATPTPPPPPTPTATPTPPPPPTPTPTPTPPPAPGACPSSTPNVEGGRAPWGGCFPNAANTGVPTGTALTAYTGPCTVTAANTVIDAKTINCALNIATTGVVIRNSYVNGTVWIENPNAGYSFTITDSTIDAGPVDAAHNDGVSALGKSGFVATRVETFRGIRGVWCEYNCTIQDSWIHGQDKDEGGHAHESGIRMGDGSIVRRNSIGCDAPDVAPDAGCSAGLTGYGDFAPIRNNTIEKNLFLATTGGTCAYGGSSGDDGSKPYGNQAANIVFKDNVFQKRSAFQSSGNCGYWFPITDFNTSRPGNQWTNNTWDTGATVPAAN